MITSLAIIAGALSRRLVGWGGFPLHRLAGQAVAAAASMALTIHLGAWPAILCALSVPLAFGLPYHGESINRPVLMGLRNGAFTLGLATALWAGWGVQAWAYAPTGLLVGFVYWAAKRWAPDGKDGAFYDGWNAAAEIGLGACLAGGLALL